MLLWFFRGSSFAAIVPSGSIWSQESPGHFGCSGLEEREGVRLPEGEVSRSGYGKCAWFMVV